MFDADELARRAMEPGARAYRAVIDRFGEGVLEPDGAIDRRALAGIVFTDERARKDLESIVHPEVFRLFQDEIQRHISSERVVVFDAPLIVEARFADACDVLVLVTAPAAARIERLVAQRGMLESDARGRMAAQSSDEDKEWAADMVIRNEGTLEDLEREVDGLWTDLRARAGELELR